MKCTRCTKNINTDTVFFMNKKPFHKICGLNEWLEQDAKIINEIELQKITDSNIKTEVIPN